MHISKLLVLYVYPISKINLKNQSIHKYKTKHAQTNIKTNKKEEKEKKKTILEELVLSILPLFKKGERW